MGRPGSPNTWGSTAVSPVSATRRANPATAGVMPGISLMTTTAGPSPLRKTVRVLPSWVNSPRMKSSSGSASATVTSPQDAVAGAPPRHEGQRLDDDTRRHLRHAPDAVDELDRHFDDAAAEAGHAVRHLDL